MDGTLSPGLAQALVGGTITNGTPSGGPPVRPLHKRGPPESLVMQRRPLPRTPLGNLPKADKMMAPKYQDIRAGA